MATNLKKLQKEIRALSSREKAALARTLIEDLDKTVDKDAEELWLKEAQRRYQKYKAGKVAAVSGEEAMLRARRRLK
jgi:putative addiction module component (TIGR02574 family)